MKNVTTTVGHESYGCQARSLVVTSAPAAEPISTATAKAHLQVASGNTADDTLIDSLVSAARHWVEQATGRRLITQTLVARYDGVPSAGAPLLLPVAPVASVTSVVSYDRSNVSSTFASASYLTDLHSAPARIALNDGYSWPSDLRPVNAVEATFVAGYGSTGASVPQPIVHALLMLVSFYYDQRAAAAADPGLTIAEMPFGPAALLGPYRVWWI